MTIREAMRNPMCASCGGAAVLGEVSLEEQHLRIENARLKDELDRVCALAGKFLGRPISSISSPGPPSLQACSGLELGVGSNGGFGLGALGASAAMQSIPDLMGGSSGLTGGPVGSAAMRLPAGIGGLDGAARGLSTCPALSNTLVIIAILSSHPLASSSSHHLPSFLLLNSSPLFASSLMLATTTSFSFSCRTVRRKW